MRLFSRELPLYLPEAMQSSVLRLGLVPLDPRTWMQCDGDFGQFHRHKLLVKRQYDDKVFCALPESRPAQDELRQTLLQHLITDRSDCYRIESGQLIHSRDNISWPLGDNDLWDCSLWVQEDLCLLEWRDGEYRLTAASVCSPSNWRLEDKIAQSVDFIHGPVPGYQRELAQRVTKLFVNLKPNKPLLRFNWSIQRGNELFWRSDLPDERNSSEQNNDERDKIADLYWRVERQTLIRLPETGAIVFAIRIYLHPFKDLLNAGQFRANLQAVLATLPVEQKRYKGIENLSLL